MSKPTTITVRAGQNGPVFLPSPIQGKRAIGDEPMEVENTPFIRRRLAVGDLVEVKPQNATAPSRAGKE